MKLFNKLNQWLATKSGRRILTWGSLLILVLLAVNIFNSTRSSHTNNPQQVLVGLNEPLWPNNAAIANVTYNGLNSKQSIAATIKTKEQENQMDLACKQTLETRNAKVVGKLPLSNLENLQFITCIHYRGAFFGDNYWALQGIDLFKLSQKRLASILESDGQTVRANLIGSLDLSGISLQKLRTPNFYKTLSSKQLQTLSLYCNAFYTTNAKNTNPQDFYFEFDNALTAATYEGCGLLSYFYSVNKNF